MNRRQLIKSGRRRSVAAERLARGKVARAVRRQLNAQTREFAERVRQGASAVTREMREQWRRDLADALRQLVIPIAERFFDMSAAEVGRDARKSASPVEHAEAKAFSHAGQTIRGKASDADFRELLVAPDWTALEEWVATTADGATETSAAKLTKIFRDAEAFTGEHGEGLTPRQIAKRLVDEGVTANKARARMLARTGTNFAANRGSMQRYLDAGVSRQQWLTVVSDNSGELDLELNGTEWEIGRPVEHGGQQIATALGPVYHPPLHPNCRCTIIPVL